MIAKETLARMDLFEGLPDGVLDHIGSLAEEEYFPAGATIFSSRAPAERIYILVEGTVSLLVEPTSLPEPMSIVLLKSWGQTFGWSAVVGSGYYTASAQAMTEVRAIGLRGRPLIEYLEQNPCEGFVVMRRIAQVVSQRLGRIRMLLLETVCD